MRASVISGVAPAVLAMVVAGCGKKTAAPDQVVRSYTDAVMHGRVDEAWPLLCAKDRAFHSLEEMRADAKALDEPNTKLVIAHTTSATGDVKIDGEHATVVQKVTSPDVNTIATRAQADPVNVEKLKSLSPEEAVAFGNKLLADAIAKPDCPMLTNSETISLVRENGEWHVVADFEGHAKREHDRAMHADPLMNDLKQ